VEFAAAVSHELRTPLAVIRAAAYNLEEGIVEDRSQVRHYARIVRDAGRRLSKMVDQILLFADTQSWRRKAGLTPVNVKDVVEKALEGVSAVLPPGRCPVEQVLPDDMPQVLANPVLLSHCVENLVINAVKYGEAGAAAPVTISSYLDRKAGELQIRVADKGRGIDPADLPHIFKPFYRGRNANIDTVGAGLGLALVHRLMQNQRGRVTVETAPHLGSTFTIHLPIVP
jgi:signal transduction histidine kinase